MDNIYEKSIVKPRDMKDNIIMLLAVLGALIISAAAFILEPVRKFALAVVVFVVYIAYRIITDRNIEYEYILAGNSITLDIIFNKRRRKRVLNCDLTDFDLVAPVASARYEEHRNNTARTISAVSGDRKEDEYFAILEYDNKRTMLVFEADDRTLGHLKKHIDHTLKV